MGRPAVSLRRSLPLFAVAALAAVAAWILWRNLPGARGPEVVPEAGPGTGSPRAGGDSRVPPRTAPSTAPLPGAGTAMGGTRTEADATGGIPPGLRTPSGEDLSDPKVLEDRLRHALGGEATRWDLVAELLGKHEGPLPPDVRAALLAAFDGGRVPAAVGAFSRLRDPTLVADLLRLLDDASTSPEARRTVMSALVSIPHAQEAVVSGLVRGLRGRAADDRPALEAIARLGGPDAVRAIVGVLARASDPEAFPPEMWRSLTLRGSPESSQILAEALARADLSPAARLAVVALAGRPGASPEVVAALIALDGPEADLEARRAVYASLAATGADEGYARLLSVASDPAAPGAAAALHALGEASTASVEARARLLATAKATSDDGLRAQAVRALGAVREPAAIPYLAELLAHPSPDVRRESVVALGGFGRAAEGTVEALGRAYVGGDPALRSRVATALGSIGGAAARRLLDQLRVGEKDDAVHRVVEEAYRKVDGGTGDR